MKNTQIEHPQSLDDLIGVQDDGEVVQLHEMPTNRLRGDRARYWLDVPFRDLPYLGTNAYKVLNGEDAMIVRMITSGEVPGIKAVMDIAYGVQRAGDGAEVSSTGSDAYDVSFGTNKK